MDKSLFNFTRLLFKTSSLQHILFTTHNKNPHGFANKPTPQAQVGTIPFARIGSTTITHAVAPSMGVTRGLSSTRSSGYARPRDAGAVAAQV